MRAMKRMAAGDEPRLIACDVDGTLLDPEGKLRPPVKSALAAVRSAGVRVVLATGRSAWSTTEIARELNLPGPHITMNGGAYGSPVTGELAWSRPMRPELVIDGLAFARGLGSAPLLCFLHRHVVERVPGGDVVVPDFAAGPRLRQVNSLAEMAGDGPIRVYIPVPLGRHARTVAEAKDWFGDRASIVFGDEDGIEIMAPNTNKGEALRQVTMSMGLDREEVAAIGDGPNDREMLRFAGQSAALLPEPGSAATAGLAVGEATQVVPSSAHDGALEALRRFFPSLGLSGATVRPFRHSGRPTAA